MAPAVSIRIAGVPDARAISVVHVRSWQAAYRGLIPQDYLDSLDLDQVSARRERSLAEQDWPRRGVLVAEQAGEIVGFSGTGPSRDDDLDPATVGEVNSIYLLPQAWGTGLGRELMSAARAGLRQAGFRDAALWVLDTNERARRFYAADGWRPDGAAKLDDNRPGLTLSEVRYRRSLA